MSSLIDRLEKNTSYDIDVGKNIGRYSQQKDKMLREITTTQTYRKQFITHTGHVLTFREARFIDSYMVDGDKKKAVQEAGYKVQHLSNKANELLKKDYIADEIAYRNELYQSQFISSREEVLEFLSAGMRGEIKDQFDLDPTFSDRTACAKELIRIYDNETNKKQVAQAQQVVVNIDWNRDNEEAEKVVDIQQISD